MTKLYNKNIINILSAFGFIFIFSGIGFLLFFVFTLYRFFQEPNTILNYIDNRFLDSSALVEGYYSVMGEKGPEKLDFNLLVSTDLKVIILAVLFGFALILLVLILRAIIDSGSSLIKLSQKLFIENDNNNK